MESRSERLTNAERLETDHPEQILAPHSSLLTKGGCGRTDARRSQGKLAR